MVDSGRFSKTPVSQTVVANEVVVFRCQPTPAFIITWTINGSDLRSFPDVVLQGSDNVSTLSLVGRPEYNHTVVECVALLLIGSTIHQSERASAILMIQGTYLHMY